MKVDVPYLHTGRTNQKARTRDALISAARQLLARGVTPTLEEAAAEAAIGRTTAYRYFPNTRALLAATIPELEMDSLLGADPPEDPLARLENVAETLTRRIVEQKYRGLSPLELAVVATEENVLVQMNNLSTHPCVAARLSSGELRIFGWYYDIGCGQIYQFDQRQGRFEELNGQAFAAQPLPIRAASAAEASAATV